MTFSLSPRASSRAMGRYGCPFGFLAFFNFFPKISFRILLRAVMICEESSQALKRNHFVGVTFEDGGTRHAADHAAVFALRNGHPASGLNRAKAFGTVFAHAEIGRASCRERV